MRGWFLAHRNKFATMFAPLVGTPVHYLEIGVCMGESLLWITENILTHPDSRAIGVDFWDLDPTPGRPGHAVQWEQVARAILDPFDDKVRLIKGDSKEVLPSLESEHTDYFDIVYIDGDHFYDGCMADSRNAWPLTKIGGVVIWDDTHVGAYRTRGKGPGVMEATKDFLTEYSGRYEVVTPPGKRQIWVKKLS